MLSAVGLSKSYSGVRVVDGASIEVGSGEIHAVVGENGAGKSTLLRMIGGLVRPDAGLVSVDGVALPGRGRTANLRAGIAIVTQELAAIPARSVIENVFLGHRSSLIGTARANFRSQYDELCQMAGVRLDPDIPAGQLSLGDLQMLEILRALALKPKVLLLDEPTTTMGFDQSERFAKLMLELAQRGLAILWVSHHLTEVRSQAEHVTVMRDGAVVGRGATRDFNDADLIRLMVGYAVEVVYPAPLAVPSGAKPALRVRNLRCRVGGPSVSIEVAAGEIVGCAGLVGGGRSSFAKAIFGATRASAGEIQVDEGPWFRPSSTRQAVAAGIAMVPEDRSSQGLALRRPISENLLLPSLRRVTRLGLVRSKEAAGLVRMWIAEAGIRPPEARAEVGSLSGGNQQKVLVKKWLVTRPRVIIFDEPTRGVSVDAKVQIHRVIIDTAARGVGVILISSELEEVLALSHRVLVFRKAAVVAEFARQQATREGIMAAAFGIGVRDENHGD
jgi:ribose transport system ATP-binding protein